MAVFTYRAHRLDGGEVAGDIAAGSARAALAAVRERGLLRGKLRIRRNTRRKITVPSVKKD